MLEYIKITGISPNTKTELKEIAEKKGISISEMLRPVLKEFVKTEQKKTPKNILFP